ncbi:hypothetical protein GCM10009634_38190 [Saccharothrix xinjiangensis]
MAVLLLVREPGDLWLVYAALGRVGAQQRQGRAVGRREQGPDGRRGVLRAEETAFGGLERASSTGVPATAADHGNGGRHPAD